MASCFLALMVSHFSALLYFISLNPSMDPPDFFVPNILMYFSYCLISAGRLINLMPDKVTIHFESAIKRLNIVHFRFHDLWHYAASIMHAIGVPDQYIMQRGGWSSDHTLKAIYRGTIGEYTQKYNTIALQHFDNMQHEMQHKK